MRNGLWRRWSRSVVVMAALGVAACATEDERAKALPSTQGTVEVVPGQRLFYRVDGAAGDTVVVLHGGFGLSHEYLRDFLRPLAKAHVLVFFDGRGRGQSDPVPADSISYARDRADLDSLVTRLKLGRFSIVAHHSGSLAATTYALAHPDKVARVALLAPFLAKSIYSYDLASESMDSVMVKRNGTEVASGLPSRDPYLFCAHNWGFLMGPVEELDSAITTPLTPFVCDSTKEHYKFLFDAKISFIRQLGPFYNWLDTLRGVTPPQLVLMGDEDKIQTFWSTLYASLPKEGRLKLYPGISPLYPWLERRRQVRDDLSTFLAGKWPDGAVTKPVRLNRPVKDSL